MTQQQVYQYNEYFRRQQLLRAYVQACGDDGYSQEEHDKRNPRSQENLRNALSDDTIHNVTLQNGFEVSGDTFAVAKDFNINLSLNKINANGLVGSKNDSVITVKRGGNLTIDGSGSAGIYDNDDSAWAAIKLTHTDDSATGEESKVTVNGGRYVAKYYAVTGNGSRQNTNLTINDGEFVGVADDAAAIYHPQSGIMTINSGSFSAPGNAIYIKSGNITINNGYFEATGVSAEYIPATGSFNPTGDAIVVDNCGYPGEAPQIVINGGTFISENASPIASYAKEGFDQITGFVYGGKFNRPIDEVLVAEGYKQVQDGDYWTVIPE